MSPFQFPPVPNRNYRITTETFKLRQNVNLDLSVNMVEMYSWTWNEKYDDLSNVVNIYNSYSQLINWSLIIFHRFNILQQNDLLRSHQDVIVSTLFAA